MRPTLKIFVPALAVSLALAACGSSSNSTGSSASTSTPAPAAPSASAVVVKTASNSTLGATVLVDSHGLTIYHLTGEGNGKFICDTAECEKHWPPLSAGAGAPSISGLGTVKRPDGTEQLTYKGEPLYTFAGDTAPGQANGEGVKDVGTWMAVTTGASSASTSNAAPAAASSSSGAGSSGSGESGSGGSSSSGGYGY